MYDIGKAIDQQIVEQSGLRPTVIFTEPTDPRTIEAVCRLARFIRPVFLAPEASVRAIAAAQLQHVDQDALDFAISESAFMVPSEHPQLLEEFAREYQECFQDDQVLVSPEEARERVAQQGVFGIMAVRLGHADMVVGGAVHSPKEYYRPMVRLLKRSGFCTEVGVFALPDSHPAGVFPHNLVVFGDVGANATMSPSILANVAVGTCVVARDIIPESLQPIIRGVLVSYSHNGSDEGPSPELVRETSAFIPKFLQPRIERNGRYAKIQFRGEVKASVALSARSARFYREDGAQWEGSPNVIVCPNMEMGNMLYHLYATSYPDSQYFTVMFGLGNRAVSLARDGNVDSLCLAVKATVLRLLRFPEYVPSHRNTFFKRPTILAINPGSISTKISVYRGEELLFNEELLHSVEDLRPFEGLPASAQLEMRTKCIVDALKRGSIALESLDALACRGGLLRPIPHGTYAITPTMLEELKEAKWGDHPCNLGAMIGQAFSQKLHIPAYVVDPGVVDELPMRARLTGLKEIRRRCISHALNAYAQTRRYATEQGTFYDRLNLIVAHIGGGISIGAHKRGHYIDVNNALDGEGPFSPERSGSLPVGQLIDLCFSGKYTREELRRLNRGKGGMLSLLGTADMREIERRYLEGEQEVVDALEAMAYAIAKGITALWPAFDGEEVEAVILTGGASRCQPLINKIKKYISATKVKVVLYPGEWEMPALANGVARVLNGKEKLKDYPPQEAKKGGEV